MSKDELVKPVWRFAIPTQICLSRIYLKLLRRKKNPLRSARLSMASEN